MSLWHDIHNAAMLLIVVPLVGSMACAACKLSKHTAPCKIAALLSTLAGFALLAVTYPAIQAGGTIRFTAGGWQPGIGIDLAMDGLSWVGALVVLIVCLAGLLFTLTEKSYPPLFYFTYLIMMAGMLGVLLTRDLFNLFVFIEILAIAVYLLISFFEKDHSLVASFKYLILGSTAITFYLIGVFVVYQATGSVSMETLAAYNAAEPGQTPLPLMLALCCFIVGIGLRAAFVPFHCWLPEAHAYAPHPVSAALSGVMIKVAVIALWRLVDLFPAVELIRLFPAIGAGTALLGAVWTISETDLKKRLAYSSISHLGFIVTALGIDSAGGPATASAVYHIVTHAFFKSLLFLCAGAVIVATGERNIGALSGLGRRLPLVGALFTIALLSIAGIPPFGGYASKKLILEAAGTCWPLAALLMAAAAISLAAYIEVWKILVGATPAALTVKPLSASLAFSLVPLAALCLATGLLPAAWFGFFVRLTGGSLPAAGLPAVYSPDSLLTSAALTGAGIALYRLSRTSGCRSILKAIRGLRLGLEGALCLLLASFIGLTWVTWLP